MKNIGIFICLLFTFSSLAFAQKERDFLWWKKEKKDYIVSQKKSEAQVEAVKMKLQSKLDKKLNTNPPLSLKQRKELYNALSLKITQILQEKKTPQKNIPLLKLLKEIIHEKKNNLK